MKELFDGEYAIPEGYTASVENGKIIVKKEENVDEKIREEIIDYLSTADDKELIPYESWIAWLEKQGKNNMGISEATKQKLEDSLHKALEKETPESLNEFLDKQKPTWSEEDENRFRNLIYLVEHNEKSKGTKQGFIEFINRLKSLKERYTWKPSDEQMKLLREVQQALLGKDCHNRFVGFMYELKKLREE